MWETAELRTATPGSGRYGRSDDQTGPVPVESRSGGSRPGDRRDDGRRADHVADAQDDHGSEHEDDQGNEHDRDHQHPGEHGHDHDHQHDHDHEADHDHHDHDHHHHDLEELGVAVLTVSSTRTIESDSAGGAIESAVEAAGHEVTLRELVTDEYDGVQDAVDRLADRDDVDTVVTSGGTGVTPDDVTIEAARPLFDKELPGFGELFRRLSYEEIGTRVIGTRSTAGVVDGVPVFCLPGSENAARLGAEILLEEAPHLAGLARREGGANGDEPLAEDGSV